MVYFISSFIGGLLGSVLGVFLFLYYINPSEGKSPNPKLEKNSIKAGTKPKGTILKSPEPEAERKRKLQEFEKKVYARKETIL